MHPFIQFKRVTPTILALALACVGLSQSVQAVSPTPDGCYPNFTTAEGCNALNLLTTGAGNTGLGWRSLFSDSTGSFNTGVGAGTLAFNTADDNTATGAGALLSNTTGSANTANGIFALFHNTSGNGNTAVGTNALANSTGLVNTALGFQAGFNVTAAVNVICIGANIGGANVNNSCFIGNIRGVTTQHADAIPVVIDSTGQLGTMSSSKRFKKEIKPIDKASEAVLALNPVTFHYESDKTDTPQFGLIAEEVADVNPDLVVRDENGEIYTVRYDAVNAMLLNEFRKEHHQVQDLKAIVAEQQKQIEALAAGLQKVSAKLELSKPALQTVKNNN